VFFNISAFGKPVKTAIFLGGQEFETWSKVLADIHKREDLPPYDEELYRRVLRDKRIFLTPELTAGTGQFPLSKPRVVEDGREYHFGKELPPCFQNYAAGFAVLRISLVMQSLISFERIGLVPGEEVFTEGGFRKNEAYNILLSSALRDNPVFLTDIAEASALGAAMTAKMALTGQGLSALAKDFEVEYQEVVKSDIPELFPYRAAWMEWANRD
jgi:hypothetical protein